MPHVCAATSGARPAAGDAGGSAVPALSIPAGVHDGLPVGIQVMGPLHSELKLLALASKVSETIARPPDFPKPLCDLAREDG